MKFMKVLTQKHVINMFLAIILLRLSALMIGLVSQFLSIEVKMLLMNLLKHFLKNISTAKNNERTFQ